jgi:hypothetical protein
VTVPAQWGGGKISIGNRRCIYPGDRRSLIANSDTTVGVNWLRHNAAAVDFGDRLRRDSL